MTSTVPCRHRQLPCTHHRGSRRRLELRRGEVSFPVSVLLFPGGSPSFNPLALWLSPNRIHPVTSITIDERSSDQPPHCSFYPSSQFNCRGSVSWFHVLQPFPRPPQESVSHPTLQLERRRPSPLPTACTPPFLVFFFSTILLPRSLLTPPPPKDPSSFPPLLCTTRSNLVLSPLVPLHRSIAAGPAASPAHRSTQSWHQARSRVPTRS